MPDKVVQVQGIGNVSFPGTMSDDEIAGHIRDQLSAGQPQQPNPETFGQGLKSTLPIGGTGFGPMARIKDFIGMAGNQIASMKDAYDKAVDAHSKGRDFEAATHLIGLVPFVGPALHHAGETLGGTEAQFDKFGNIIKPGMQPNPAGATGEALGLAAPSLIDAASGAPKAVGAAGAAVKEAVTKPGVGKIALGTGETAAGGAALLHGNLFGMYPLARGIKTIGKGLAERTAAKAGAADAELEAFAPGFSKMSEKDQALTRMVYDRMKNGPPPSSAPPPGRIGPLYAPAQPEAAPPAEAQPTLSPVAAVEAAPEAVTPPAQPPAPEPPPQPAQATVAPPKSPAEALFEEAQRSGTVPATAKPGEPFGGTVPEPEPFKQAARGKRAATAETLTNAFRDYGLSSEDLRDMQPKEWATTADALGIEFPKTAAARQKLIDATIQRFEGGGTATVRARATSLANSSGDVIQNPPMTAPQASAGTAPPSLGTTGRDIYQGWKALAEGSSPPRAVIEGFVPGLGRFDFRNGQIVRLMKQTGRTGTVSTYAPATDAEIQGIHDAIDRGQFQVEQRTISGAGGVRKFQDAGALEKVFHQATGRPLPEFLETPEGKAWAKHVGYSPR